MKSIFMKTTFFILSFSLVISPSVQALIIRHDVPENEYAKLANDFESVQSLYKKLAGENIIDSIYDDERKTMIFADFDAPTDGFNKTGSAKPLPLEFGISGGLPLFINGFCLLFNNYLSSMNAIKNIEINLKFAT